MGVLSVPLVTTRTVGTLTMQSAKLGTGYKHLAVLLDFLANRFFVNVFKTSDISAVAYCQVMFQFDLAAIVLFERSVWKNLVPHCLVKLISFYCLH